MDGGLPDRDQIFCIGQLFSEWFLKRVNISWFLKAGIEASDVYETIRCHARSEGRNKLVSLNQDCGFGRKH